MLMACWLFSVLEPCDAVCMVYHDLCSDYLELFYNNCDTADLFTSLHNIPLCFQAVIYLLLLTL
jgi:hypothetical protein